jgi:cytochrome P450
MCRTLSDCVVPLHFPITNVQTGEEMKQLTIHKGTSVYVGLAATNMSTAIWGPDAHVFNPERWLEKDKTFTAKTPGIFGNM